ncbi:organic cation transporter protein-like [Amphiura filiformis]|uniref:organic cation transporter protein-like n=1 Tax=Amphiura filiformis TaxID=82378 RepID=UPI003B2257AD
MHFEEIVKRLGEFGRFQRRVYFLLCLVAIPNAWHAIGAVFLTANTDHWCNVPSVPGLNCTSLNLTESQCIEKRRNLTVPYKITGSTVVYEQCTRYNDTVYEEEIFYNASSNDNNTDVTSQRKIVGCGKDGWEYDHSQYTNTAVTEFNLVCKKKALPNLSQSIFMAGFLFGSIFFGTLSDWIGRLPTLFICIGCEAVVGTIAAFAPNFNTFAAMRFFVGMCNLGAYMTAFVLGTEFVGPQYRACAGTLIPLFFSVGYMTLAVLAYFIRDWRDLQLAISVPLALFFILIPFVSESARWLMSNGKYDRAEKIIRRAAKVNKVELPDVLFDENDKEARFTAGGRRPTQLDLFRTPNLRFKTLNILYNWFVINLVYYGLSLSTSVLGVNVYLAAFVSGAVEFPAYLSCWFIVQRFGRKVPLCLYMVVGGVTCLLTIVVPLGVPRTIVAMVGKFCISASFGLIYIFSAEIYPTVVRGIGMGLASMSARVSGILSPLILLLGNYWAPLPVIIFGVNSILAGLLVLLLPETLGVDLPQSLEDGEEYGRGESKLPCFQKTSNYHHGNGYKPTPKEDNHGDEADDVTEQKV